MHSPTLSVTAEHRVAAGDFSAVDQCHAEPSACSRCSPPTLSAVHPSPPVFPHLLQAPLAARRGSGAAAVKASAGHAPASLRDAHDAEETPESRAREAGSRRDEERGQPETPGPATELLSSLLKKRSFFARAHPSNALGCGAAPAAAGVGAPESEASCHCVELREKQDGTEEAGRREFASGSPLRLPSFPSASRVCGERGEEPAAALGAEQRPGSAGRKLDAGFAASVCGASAPFLRFLESAHSSGDDTLAPCACATRATPRSSRLSVEQLPNMERPAACPPCETSPCAFRPAPSAACSHCHCSVKRETCAESRSQENREDSSAGRLPVSCSHSSSSLLPLVTQIEGSPTWETKKNFRGQLASPFLSFSVCPGGPPHAGILAPPKEASRPVWLAGGVSPLLARGESGAGRVDGLREEILFFQELPVKVKSGADREAFVCPLTVKLAVSGGAHGTGFQQVLRVELTDRQNLFVHYSAEVGETDFARMRSEQRLLIDFQAFPGKFVDLLEECAFSYASAQGGDTGPPQRLAAVFNCPGFCGSRAPAAPAETHAGNAEFSSFLPSLECCSSGKMSAVSTAGEDAWLSLVEMNLFKELTHLSLRVRKSSDETLKLHLAQQLATFQIFSAKKMEANSALEKQCMQLQEQLASISHLFDASQAEIARFVEETKEKQQETLEKTLAAHAAEAEEVVKRLGEEQREAEERHAAEREELKRKVEKAEQELLLTTGRNRTLEEELRQLQSLYEEVRSQVGEAVGRCGEVEGREKQEREGRCLLEQRTEELRAEVAKLRERDVSHSAVLREREALLAELQAQKAALQETVTQQKAREVRLEEELNTAIQEIHRGNDIIAKLQQHIRTFKMKRKARSADRQALEKDVAALTLKSASLQQQLEQKHAEEQQKMEQVGALSHRCEQLSLEIEQLQEELAAAKDVNLRLNKELTTRQLETYMRRYGTGRGSAASPGTWDSSALSGLPASSFPSSFPSGEKERPSSAATASTTFSACGVSPTPASASLTQGVDAKSRGEAEAERQGEREFSRPLFSAAAQSTLAALAGIDRRSDSHACEVLSQGRAREDTVEQLRTGALHNGLHAQAAGSGMDKRNEVDGRRETSNSRRCFSSGGQGDSLAPFPAESEGPTFADRLRAASSAARQPR
ncbi:hypothetical protein TGME49_306430 [Toxoplasma gondii ME49]|uniref:Spindle assembly abnormal protein 6 N-terminal domain-containing protein n=3 Tax=Toxoplasma gondii TaxID=5811 RepID=A0A0F7V199_TOXGV|nr:hypothetical protein TGME49_306430 [Toxoplasma gondii ME49]EPT27468.1 hypothetical protein TGME49_306430 [Toxoplasma gondii ME49]ESS28971.1 hypothetical protein TGVEG_306430 [Toxoplasma gondii VEG]CEL76280.1 TPA: hypothetical protein BN1205_107890 [Toxoplasma gondii VEG]|eukprot:XP_018636174.1 hypothetical protein TGME49_306430 [Toxoplasma gondii ME49]